MAYNAADDSDREFRTAQEIVAERLRRRILIGDLRPGDRLLQADIAREMHTSTTPVREALWQLAGAGMLDVDPHRGVSVHIPTREELTDIYDLRVLLEPLAVAAAIDNITEEELQVIEAIIEDMEGASDVGTVVILNTAFHNTLASGSRRPRLAEILIRLNNVAMLYVVSNLYRIPGRVRNAIDEHRQIVAACRERDKERAKGLVVDHLRGTLILGQEAFDQVNGGSRTKRR